ncbi:MAG: Flp family type IVb pilin [Chloroflexota bacterium]|nr:Flp family type IVb pilin [Chloroflexota bacterium]
MLNEVMFKVAALTQMLRARFEQEEGQGLVEYALIIALVSAALVLALGALSTSLDGIFGYITGLLDGAATTAP